MCAEGMGWVQFVQMQRAGHCCQHLALAPRCSCSCLASISSGLTTSSQSLYDADFVPFRRASQMPSTFQRFPRL